MGWPQATNDSIEQLQVRYRIHSFSTTLLIDPDAKIISLGQTKRNNPGLRGNELLKSLDRLAATLEFARLFGQSFRRRRWWSGKLEPGSLKPRFAQSQPSVSKAFSKPSSPNCSYSISSNFSFISSRRACVNGFLSRGEDDGVLDRGMMLIHAHQRSSAAVNALIVGSGQPGSSGGRDNEVSYFPAALVLGDKYISIAARHATGFLPPGKCGPPSEFLFRDTPRRRLRMSWQFSEAARAARRRRCATSSHFLIDQERSTEYAMFAHQVFGSGYLRFIRPRFLSCLRSLRSVQSACIRSRRHRRRDSSPPATLFCLFPSPVLLSGIYFSGYHGPLRWH